MKKFKVGQVWKYNNRDFEKESTLLLLRIDVEEDEEIFHIQVDGLNITNPNNLNEPIDIITHFPFSREALESSVVSYCGDGDIPDFSEGYDLWRESYEKGDAGIFSISVGEAVQFMDETVNEKISHNQS